MKKILVFLTVMLPLIATSQFAKYDTVQVSLTMRAQDWAWCVGRHGDGSDSTSRAEIRNIRTQLITLNPPTWATNATITSVSGGLVVAFYSYYAGAGFQEVQAMGNTNGERATIWTNIRAINNALIQDQIVVIDQGFANQYTANRKRGKEILLDNSGSQTTLSRTPIQPIIIVRPRRTP